MIEEKKCPICQHESLETITQYRFQRPTGLDYWDNTTYASRRLWILFHAIIKEQNEVVFSISHCISCDYVFLNPRYSDEEIRSKYETLNQFNSTSTEYSKDPIQYIDERAERISTLVANYLGTRSQRMAILDYGGQFGHNLKKFDGARFEKHIIDFEHHALYDEVIYRGEKIENVAEGSFDVILANHVLEHINYPRELLTKLVSRLAPEGLLYVEVPCGVFREAFNVQEPLTHLNFFSEKCLFTMFDMAGLSVVHLSTKYQWITVDKEWCINIVGKKTASIEHHVHRSPRDMASTQHEPLKYLSVIYEKLRSKTPLRYLVGPSI